MSHSQFQVLFLLTVYDFSIFSYKGCNQFHFGINHLVMSMCEVVSCVVEKGCLLWPVHSLGRIQLAFALLHFVLQGQTCLLFSVSLDFLLLLFSPRWWIEQIFFLVLGLGGLLGLHRTDQLCLLWHWHQGHRLGLLWCWMACLGSEPRSCCHFGGCTHYCILDSFVDYEGYSISSTRFLPTVIHFFFQKL